MNNVLNLIFLDPILVHCSAGVGRTGCIFFIVPINLPKHQQIPHNTNKSPTGPINPPQHPQLNTSSYIFFFSGTFIALYKLWLDHQNPKVTSLSILPTVLAMRYQRCKMVQKQVNNHKVRSAHYYVPGWQNLAAFRWGQKWP